MMAMLLPKVQAQQGLLTPSSQQENRRLAQALFPESRRKSEDDSEPDKIDIDATLTFSEREILRGTDFETMSADEWIEAKRALSELRLAFEPLPTRRTQRAAHPGRTDWRATMSVMVRHGGELWDMRWRKPRERNAPLVVLADISGSMSRYSRMLLHFAHNALVVWFQGLL